MFSSDGFSCGLEAAALVPSEPAEELLDENDMPVVEKPVKMRREGPRWKRTETETFRSGVWF